MPVFANVVISTSIRPDDQRVLERLKQSPAGASGIDIARAALGWKARKHSLPSLDLIGLSIAARLVGDGLIARPGPTGLSSSAARWRHEG